MKTINTLLLILLPLFALTQSKRSYKVGTPYKYIDAHADYQFPNEDTTETLTIKIRGFNMYFQKFNHRTRSEIKVEKTELYREVPSGSSIIHISKFGGKILCFYMKWAGEDKKWIVGYKEIDFRSCKFIGKEKTLFETQESPAAYWNFPYHISKDKSKIMFFWRHYPKKFKDKLNYDVFSFHTFDTELNPLEATKITMPYTEKKMDHNQILLHSNGTAYMLARVFNDDTRDVKKKKGGNKVVNYHYEVFQIDLSSKNILKTSLALENTLMTNLYLSESTDENMFVSGFYTNKSNKDLTILGIKVSEASVDGLCLFQIDDIGSVLDQKKIEIPNDIVNQYEGTKNNKKKNPELVHLKMRKIASQEDGSRILIAEQFSYSISTSTSTSSSGGITTTTTKRYNYDDILVCKLDARNEVVWMKKLPKSQVGVNRFADLGFNYQYLNGNHCFIFLDNVKNIDLPLNQKPVAHSSEKWGYLTYYKVEDRTGNVSKHSVFTTKGIPVSNRKRPYLLYFFKKDEVIKTSNNTFMMEFYKKSKEDVMIEVKVN